MPLYFSILVGLLQLCTNQCNAQITWSTAVTNSITFSSPRLIDLTGDDILDVVIGDGIEDSIWGNVRALNGIDGSELWHLEVAGDIFASALFYDINQNGLPDVIVGGRSRQFVAIDGLTGQQIWAFDTTQNPPAGIGWMQFYNAQLIPDQTGDGLLDIIVTNGGNPNAMAGTGPRYPGWILVVSSSDGTLLQQAVVPDSAETYSSLVIADIESDGVFDVVFGTGGETFPGGLWRVTLDELLQGDISGSIALASNSLHGFVAAPVLADINQDGILDIVAADAEGKIRAFDGSNNLELWGVQLPNTECYSTPAIGQFTGDSNLDVYANIGQGVWPFFDKYYQVMIDGSSGQVAYFDSIGHQFSSPLSFDFDNNGYDEVVLSSNATSIFMPNTYSVLVIDFTNQSETVVYQQLDAVSGASTPWIGDIDGDNFLDLIIASNTGASIYNYAVSRVSLNYSVDGPVLWGAYHGSNYNGVYGSLNTTPLAYDRNQPVLKNDFHAWPNPATDKVWIESEKCLETIILINSMGQVVSRAENIKQKKTQLNLANLQSGIYLVMHDDSGAYEFVTRILKK